MLRDNLVELIEPMLNSAGADPLALYIHTRTPASDDRLPCLKNPRPEGAESSLTESASSPFQAEPAHSLIGEVYAKDRSGIHQLMEEISRAGFGPCEEFSIPQPTAYLPALHLLLQERVEGRPARESFLSDNESERTAVAERCARWLARFHAIAPRMEPIFHLGSYLRSIDRWFRRLALPGQPFADKATQLFERLEIAASKLHGIEMCATHGSYNHSQVILAQGRTSHSTGTSMAWQIPTATLPDSS